MRAQPKVKEAFCDARGIRVGSDKAIKLEREKAFGLRR